MDAAYLAMLPGTVSVNLVVDDPRTGELECDINTGNGVFIIIINESGIALQGNKNDFSDNFHAETAPASGSYSLSQLHACRAEVIKSFVWNQHCAPFLGE